jgi:spermidine synthase
MHGYYLWLEPYFEAKEGKNSTVYNHDGLEFMKATPKRNEVVIMDAYSGGDMPGHMISAEVFSQLDRITADNGIVGIGLSSASEKDSHNQIKSAPRLLVGFLP